MTRAPDRWARAREERERRIQGLKREVRSFRAQLGLLEGALILARRRADALAVADDGTVRGLLPCGHGVQWLLRRQDTGALHCTSCAPLCSRCHLPLSSLGELRCGCQLGAT